MTKNKKMASSKKIVIAVALASLLVIGAIITVVAVLAANAQNVSSNISVSYIVDGVGAHVKANYATVATDPAIEVTKVAMKDGTNETASFTVNQAETDTSLSPAGDITLTATSPRVVFEYYFKNTADSAFSITLCQRPTGNNITETWAMSQSPLTGNQYRTRINKPISELVPQQLTTENAELYIYIAVEVTDLNRGASYNGSFAWVLSYGETINVTLDNGGTTNTLKVIPSSAVANIAMPTVGIPTGSNTFIGYYAGENGTSDRYYNELGLSTHVAPTSATTLYAYFAEIANYNGTALTSLTDAGNELSNINIPDGVTEISANALKNNPTIETLTISNDVTSIGESAFENCTNLSELNLGTDSNATASATSLLTTIGNNAFKNCSNLQSVTIPASVTLIGSGAFNACENLKNVTMQAGQKFYKLSEDAVGTNKEKISGDFASVLKNTAKYIIYYDPLVNIMYPQTYVGDTLNNTLKTMLVNSALTATGKTYKIYVGTNNTNEAEKTLVEYEYDGQKYAYLDSATACADNYKFKNNTTIVDGSKYFFKVEPVEFETITINGRTVYMAKDILGSMQFNPSGSGNSWATSKLRTYLKDTFGEETGLNEIAKEIEITNTSTKNYTTDGSADPTTDKLWLLSYNEINDTTNFANNAARKAKVSDLAKATYTYWNSSYDAGQYFLRSAGFNSDYVCYVYSNGLVYSSYYYHNTRFGFRVAFELDD